MGCGSSAKPSQAPRPEKASGREVPPRKLQAIRAAFKVFDTDGSGAINGSELKALLEKISTDDLSEADRGELLKSMDTDKGGQIEFEEFAQWVMKNEGADDAISDWSLAKGLGKLHEAAIKDDVDTIRSLIEAGEKVSVCDISDVTPLHFACRVGKTAAAEALLEKKADISARTSDAGRMPLHAAAEKGTSKIVEMLLAANAEVNALDGRDRTPLHWACASGRNEAALLLLNAKADVNGKSSGGYTPFAMAQDWSSTILADLIAKHGGTR